LISRGISLIGVQWRCSVAVWRLAKETGKRVKGVGNFGVNRIVFEGTATQVSCFAGSALRRSPVMEKFREFFFEKKNSAKFVAINLRSEVPSSSEFSWWFGLSSESY
jgi:hypothetical protein